MKMTEKLSDLVSMQDEEKQRLGEQMEMAKQAESKRQEALQRKEARDREMAKQAEIKWQESFQRMEARHKEEKEKLRREMEVTIEDQRKVLTEETRKAAEARMGVMNEM